MWKLRSCPKCEGDLYVDWDMNGWFVQCLQCGYTSDLDSLLKAKREQLEKDKRLARVRRDRTVAK